MDHDFVQEIDREIKNIKEQESERVSYMTYAMKIQEERDDERKNSTIEHIKSLMQRKGWSIEDALDALSVPETEWNQYKVAIQRLAI